MAGVERSWADVPYPEKLGLALQVLEEGPDDAPDNDPPAAMAGVLGLSRLRQTTRAEFAVLLRCVGEMREQNGGVNEIRRASGGGSMCQYVKHWVVAG